MIKRDIQEQDLNVKLLGGDILINGYKYELEVKKSGLWLGLNVKKLTPSKDSWEITAGTLGMTKKGKISQDGVEIITKQIGKKEINLKDKDNNEYKLKLVKEEKMKKVVKLTELDLNNLVRKVLEEQREENYMFFSNLEQMKRQIEMLLEMDPSMVDEIIQNGHDWADDHISEAKTNMDQVFDFLMNETKKMKSYIDYEDINEGRKKAGTKLCARGLAAAKGKFKVHPSAYSNGYGVQVCKGDQPGLDGKKYCSGSYC